MKSVKQKIRIAFNDITGFGLEVSAVKSAILSVEIIKPPTFWENKGTTWEITSDFTKKRDASRCRRHVLTFPPDALNKPLENLLKADIRLLSLAFSALSASDHPFFHQPEESQTVQPLLLADKEKGTSLELVEEGKQTIDTTLLDLK